MYSGPTVAVLIFLILDAALLLLLPRKWAIVPIVFAACFMTQGQGVELGPFSFSILRMVYIVGFTRVVVRREHLDGGINALDKVMILWGIWALCSSVFHRDPAATAVEQMGTIYDAFSLYFLVRILCSSFGGVRRFCRIIVTVLIPLALCMAYEVIAMRNVFAVFGGVNEVPHIRNGRVRASGPFRHPILAGTAGAVCIPLAIALWRTSRATAVVGTLAAIAMIYESGSSGPIMSAAAGLVGLCAWPLRRRMKMVRVCIVGLYIVLELVMKAPAYFIIAKLDVVGGSTGYYRAALIRSALRHFKEWWIGGTDYTRHWMPTGVTWSPDHVDITSQYLINGVSGGILLVALFIAILTVGFSIVGQSIKRLSLLVRPEEFFMWALGASLFAHVITCLSVSYYDQSRCFIYFLLASIGSASIGEASGDGKKQTEPTVGRGSIWFGNGAPSYGIWFGCEKTKSSDLKA